MIILYNNYKNIIHASFFVALSAFLYGFLGYLGTSIIHDNISISTMLFWRFLIAGSWMLLFVIRKNSTSQLLQQMDKQVLFFMFFLGAIGYAGSSEFYFIASQYTGTGLAMVIFFSYPIMIAILSWIKQPKNFNTTTMLALAAMVMGLFLLRDPAAHPLSLVGILFAMISAGCYAFYVTGSKRFSSVTMDSNVLAMVVCFACASIFLVISFFTHTFLIPHSVKDWTYLLALGIFATALPIQLMLEGLKYISSMRASIISVLEPLMTMFVGVLLLKESVSHLQMLGALIILGSALLIQFQKEL